MANGSRHPLLFRYPGGKHYAIDILKPFWSSTAHEEYREPFAGGASVFFNKPKVDTNWLNDVDSELVTTMRVVADARLRRQLIKRVEAEVASKERWREVMDYEPKSDLDIAFKYFYLNRTSFSGKLISAAWGYRPKRSLPPDRWSERIDPCGEKLSDVQITSNDFEQVINAPSKNDVLMFVDPPYFSPAKKKHYRNGFSPEDHIRLSEALKKTKHKFFLTYDDCPGVRSLYKWANLFPIEFFYRVDNSAVQAGQRKTGLELVISNYEVSP